MSVSSNSRKESTESYAAQGMHNTMGIPPELAQLNDKNLENELPSRVASSNDTDVPGDLERIDELVAETDDSQPTDADLEEAKRASWGQPPLPADADDASTDRNDSTTNYQQPANSSGMAETGDPDQTLGNS